jgi:Icc-related predicted phosphoesterase
MIPFPSNVFVIADYQNYHFSEKIKYNIDFVLSCGDVEFQILEEIYERFKKPIFAVKGNHDQAKSFPKFVTDVHFNVAQHRNWFIGGWQGVPSYKSTGHYEWDDMGATKQLSNFPYVDIFICHAPVYKLTDKEDYAHTGSEAILKYIKDKQPKYVYHGHVHSEMGTMIGKTAVVSVIGAKLFTLT